MNWTDIKQYTDSLNLTCSYQDCLDIVDFAKEYQIIDYKQAVWEFLDTFEGICHSRDMDYWKGKE